MTFPARDSTVPQSTDDLSAARSRIAAAYDPKLLREAGHRLADQLADQLQDAETSRGAVLPWCDPPKNARYAFEIARSGFERNNERADRETCVDQFADLVETMLGRGHNLHDPRYIGHQVASSVPIAGLFDAVGAVTNQGMAIYEMGPWATAVEEAMVAILGERIGWQPGSFAGFVTHGGSLANLTGLLTARNVSLGDAWERGVARAGLPPALIVQADAHYSVARSAGILGLGTSNVLRVALDNKRRMDPNQLDDVLRFIRKRNQPIVAVVACACATPIGAFDPLPEIVDICRHHEVWLHVDAAHGGSALLSKRHRHLVAGIEGADSIVWDAHKMMFVPALCTFVFYKNREHRFDAFRQDAPYLFDPTAPGLADHDSGLKTIECTKRAAVFGLWGTWSLFGPGLFADLVDVTFGMGKQLHAKLLEAPDFVALHEPECNIVVFRHVPEALKNAPSERVGQFQFDLRRRLIESGEFYIVATRINDIGALRTTIINPLTTPDHLDQLLDTLRRHGRALLNSMT